MKLTCTFLLFLSAIALYAADEYAVNSNTCLGSSASDQIGNTFQLDDSTYVSVVYIRSRLGTNGVFPSDRDTTNWLLKLDKNFQIMDKKAVNHCNYDPLCFVLDKITNTICFIKFDNSPYQGMIDSLVVYSLSNFSKILAVPVFDNSGGFTLQVNEKGGYYYRTGNHIAIIDNSMQVWCNGIFPANIFDFTANWIGIDTSIVDARTYELFFDNSYLYAAYFIHTGNEKLFFVMHQVDNNFTVAYSKLMDSAETVPLAQVNYTGLFKKPGDNIIYFQNRGGNAAANYLIDSSLNIIKKSAPPFTVGGSYFYRSRTWGDKIIIPATMGGNNIFFYDKDMVLLNRISLDSLFGPYYISPAIFLDFFQLSDSGAVIAARGSYNGATNYHFIKIDKDGFFSWACGIPETYKWKNKILHSCHSFQNYTGYEDEWYGQVETIDGKDRSFSVFDLALDALYTFNKDTTVIVDYKINLDDGRIVDTVIAGSFISTANGKFFDFDGIRRNNNRYAFWGATNQICAGQLDQFFSAASSKNFNTVNAKVFLDFNSNDIKDINEPYYANSLVQLAKNDGTGAVSYFDDDGIHVINCDTGTFIVSVIFDSEYFVSVPLTDTVIFTAYGNTDSLDFALQPKGVVNDLGISLYNTFVTRPGFAGTYQVTAVNNGNTIQDAVVKSVISGKLDNISTIPAATISGDTLVWNIAQFIPSGQEDFTINYTAKTPPDLNNGDTLFSFASIYPLDIDISPADNISELFDAVRGSYDPNDKTANRNQLSPEEIANGVNIAYTIRFENTGTDTAFQIFVSDTLDNNVNAATFKPLSSSHPFMLTMSGGNILHFELKPIKLAPGEHGFISYQVTSKKSISPGTFIKNRASIVFDYNLPVVTDYATTEVKVMLPTAIQLSENQILNIFPNPGQGSFTISLPQEKELLSIKITDLNGRKIWEKDQVNSSEYLINAFNFETGMYLIIAHSKKQDFIGKIEILH